MYRKLQLLFWLTTFVYFQCKFVLSRSIYHVVGNEVTVIRNTGFAVGVRGFIISQFRIQIVGQVFAFW